MKGLELLNIDIYVIFMQKDFSKQEYEHILGHNFSHGITGCEICLRESGLRLTC